MVPTTAEVPHWGAGMIVNLPRPTCQREGAGL